MRHSILSLTTQFLGRKPGLIKQTMNEFLLWEFILSRGLTSGQLFLLVKFGFSSIIAWELPNNPAYYASSESV